jgi:hypothetical protein
MYLYEASLSIQGSVCRWPLPPVDRVLQRARALDSLILSRIHKTAERPNLLLFASSDAQRPPMSSLFSRTTILNSLTDLWNAILKEPYGHACFAQIVDQAPGLQEPSRAALEVSLAKVKPFDMMAFEQLLETQDRIYRTPESQALLQDNLGRLLSVGPVSRRRGNARTDSSRSLTCIEAFLETDAVDRGSGTCVLRGRDFPVADFRESLQGVPEFFQRWNSWLQGEGLTPSSIDRIYVYSHIKNLLPACWDELRSRAVAADQVRLPQWSGMANALSSFMEFLLTDAKRATYLYFPLNGRCHMAYLVRNS